MRGKVSDYLAPQQHWSRLTRHHHVTFDGEQNLPCHMNVSYLLTTCSTKTNEACVNYVEFRSIGRHVTSRHVKPSGCTLLSVGYLA